MCSREDWGPGKSKKGVDTKGNLWTLGFHGCWLSLFLYMEHLFTNSFGKKNSIIQIEISWKSWSNSLSTACFSGHWYQIWRNVSGEGRYSLGTLTVAPTWVAAPRSWMFLVCKVRLCRSPGGRVREQETERCQRRRNNKPVWGLPRGLSGGDSPPGLWRRICPGSKPKGTPSQPAWQNSWPPAAEPLGTWRMAGAVAVSTSSPLGKSISWCVKGYPVFPFLTPNRLSISPLDSSWPHNLRGISWTGSGR